MLNTSTIKLILLSFIVLIVSSCSSPTSSEEHADVDGLELLINDVVVYKEFDGAYYIDDAVSDVSAIISIDAGATLDVSVHFLGSDGNEIQHEDEEEDEEELAFTITNGDFISISMADHAEEEHCDDIIVQAECNDSDHCEWDETDGLCEDHHNHELEFELTGLTLGSTSFKNSLAHGDHSDYVSKLISVSVQ